MNRFPRSIPSIAVAMLPRRLLRAPVIFLLLSVVVSPAVFAGGYSSGVSITTVEAVDSNGTARVFLTFDTRPHVSSCSQDSATSGFPWRLGGNAENQKNLLALATAAQLTGRQVKVLFLETYSGMIACDGGGTSGYPVISGLIVL